MSRRVPKVWRVLAIASVRSWVAGGSVGVGAVGDGSGPGGVSVGVGLDSVGDGSVGFGSVGLGYIVVGVVVVGGWWVGGVVWLWLALVGRGVGAFAWGRGCRRGGGGVGRGGVSGGRRRRHRACGWCGQRRVHRGFGERAGGRRGRWRGRVSVRGWICDLLRCLAGSRLRGARCRQGARWRSAKSLRSR